MEKMNRENRGTTLAVLIVIGLLLTACGGEAGTTTTTAALESTVAEGGSNTTTTGSDSSTTTQTSSGDPLVIGVVAPLTGRGASFAEPWSTGLDLAVEQINASGGIEGRPVEFIFEDSESRPEGALAGATKLVTVDQVGVLLLGLPSSEIGPVAEFAAEEGIPVVNAGASTPQVRDFPGTVISTLALDDAVAAGLADWVFESGFTQAAFIVGNEPYGLGVREAVGNRYQEIGGEIVADAAVELGQADYRVEMQRVHDANPDVVITGTFADDAKLQFRQLSELGSDAPWYAMYPTVIAVEDFEPMYGNLFGLEHGWQSDEDWVASYEVLHGEAPTTPWPALAYDSFWLTALALSDSNAGSADAFADSFLTMSESYEGPSGTFSFDDSLTRSNQVFVRLQLQTGAFVVVDE